MKDCDLTVSLDDIGRCTRRMCHRALALAPKSTEEDVEEEAPEENSDDDADDEEDDIDDEVN